MLSGDNIFINTAISILISVGTLSISVILLRNKVASRCTTKS